MNEIARNFDLKGAIQQYQKENIASGVAGELLLFKKGQWTRGSGKEEVPEGTIFRPHMHEFWHGWQKFEGGHVAGLNICRFYEGKPCLRDALDANDPEQWDDPARDPWQPNWRIVMQDEEKNIVTFSTSSYGGKQAWEDLLNVYYKDREHEDMWPVVENRTEYFDTREYKRIPKPTFRVIYWQEPWASPSGTETETKAIGTASKAAEAPEAANLTTELDDENTLLGRASNAGGEVAASPPAATPALCRRRRRNATEPGQPRARPAQWQGFGRSRVSHATGPQEAGPQGPQPHAVKGGTDFVCKDHHRNAWPWQAHKDFVRVQCGLPEWQPRRRDPEALKRKRACCNAKQRKLRALRRKTPLRLSRPWEAAGMSRATWYRRGNRAAAHETKVAVPYQVPPKTLPINRTGDKETRYRRAPWATGTAIDRAIRALHPMEGPLKCAVC